LHRGSDDDVRGSVRPAIDESDLVEVSAYAGRLFELAARRITRVIKVRVLYTLPDGTIGVRDVSGHLSGLKPIQVMHESLVFGEDAGLRDGGGSGFRVGVG
jgi:hypothetical protein